MAISRPIELLAPAKDLATARAAIQHGADAVYIGAPQFGARAAAGVSLEDIARLCEEAHLYGVRVYVALNTILYEEELEDARMLIWELYRAGADAIIIQDMGITLMDLPPIPLHSSTQCDTTTPADAQQLEALGFEQIVLARELNLEQIQRISAVTSKPLEVFVHGALCVSYSGRCYISQALTQRSANRGACSQQCRMPYNLIDSTGNIIRQDEHLLSPKDLNRSELIEELLEAGASSFKIEGRLKSISYVKNITAYYRQKIDAIIARYPERYERASWGKSIYKFSPNPYKSFNRGFTDYQLTTPSPTQAKASIVNIHSPKSQGEYLGEVSMCQKQTWHIKTDKALANGDGLLYITPSGEVGGININRAMPDGVVSLARSIQVPRGTKVYRNHDKGWEDQLAGTTAERRLAVSCILRATSEGLKLDMKLIDKPHLSASALLEMELETAKRFDKLRLEQELRKLGDSIFIAERTEIDFEGKEYFVPLSLLSSLRRDATARLLELIRAYAQPLRSEHTSRMKNIARDTLPKRPHFVPDYRANISNSLAAQHYTALGYSDLSPAFELAESDTAHLMCTKHCIKYELGYCTRRATPKMPYTEPLFLEQGGKRIRLEFDCKNCQMYLLKA